MSLFKEIAIKKRLEKFTTDYRLIAGYVIAFLLLLTSYLITLYSNKKLLEQTQSVTHTYKVINLVENLLSSVKDGESGLMGLVVTKDSVFLGPLYKSFLNSELKLKQIEDETKDSQVQIEASGNLRILIKNKYDNIKLSLNVFLGNNYVIDSAVIKNMYVGKVIMDSIRNEVAKMQDREKSLLDVRTKKVGSRYTALNTIVVTSLVLAFIFAAFGVITFFKENAARQRADDKVTSYQRELKERIKELDDANKELVEMRREEKFAATGRIARIIGHEVRNPLTNIDLALTQIKEEMNKENEEVIFLIDMITRNSSRINQLITELLNATRFTDLAVSKVSINEILDETLEFAKDRIELKDITVEKHFSPEICDVTVDPEKIKIAFLNIIINAIEAIKRKGDGVLTLTTREENNKCVVEIADNGPGMSEEALSRLFEAYYTTKPKGNGLGLTNTHNIILNHKGNIDVKSKVGVGTKFIITFDFV
jgi:signal transduction histidine kinase